MSGEKGCHQPPACPTIPAGSGVELRDGEGAQSSNSEFVDYEGRVGGKDEEAGWEGGRKEEAGWEGGEDKEAGWEGGSTE